MAQCVILLANPLSAGRPITAGGTSDGLTYLIGGYSANSSQDASTCPGFMLMTPTEFQQTHSAVPSDSEVYAACLTIFAAALGAMATVWGLKRVYGVLNMTRSE